MEEKEKKFDYIETSLNCCDTCKEEAIKQYYKLKERIKELEHTVGIQEDALSGGNRYIEDCEKTIKGLREQLENIHDDCPDCDNCEEKSEPPDNDWRD